MKKNIKRITFLLFTTTFLFTLTGCAKTTTCAICLQEKKCHYYAYDLPSQDTYKEDWMCQGCSDFLRGGVESLGGTLKKLK